MSRLLRAVLLGAALSFPALFPALADPPCKQADGVLADYLVGHPNAWVREYTGGLARAALDAMGEHGTMLTLVFEMKNPNVYVVISAGKCLADEGVLNIQQAAQLLRIIERASWNYI